MRQFVLLFAIIQFPIILFSQNQREQYAAFKESVINEYTTFRGDCNKKYAYFLKEAWNWYEEKTRIPKPKDENPIPPKPYRDEGGQSPVVITPQPVDEWVSVQFYDISPKICIPKCFTSILYNTKPDAIADGWEMLSNDVMNNTIRDCLETRIRYNLCDWVYLQFLDNLCTQYCANRNSATLLQAFLYCQSGYQMRLAIDGTNLYLLYTSHHQIFNKGYFCLDGVKYHPYGNPSN